jgi:hypothetical protein
MRSTKSVLAVVIPAVFLATAQLAGQAPTATTKPASKPDTKAADTKATAKAKAAASGKSWTLARTPDGQPDLQGTWSFATLMPLERPKELGNKAAFTEAEAVEFANRVQQQVSTDRRDGGAEADVGRSYNELWRDRGTVKAGPTSMIIDPPDGRIPALTPEAKRMEETRAKVRANPPRGPEDRNMWERCLTRGLPYYPTSYNNNFQIIQTPGYVVIVTEMIHDVRTIPLDGRPHLPPTIRSWMGDSRGRWEGNTLVIDTTNFNDQASFRGSTANLHLIERLTRVDADTMNYEFTLDDPKAFARPWTAMIPTSRIDEPIYEYACHEGNYALMDILAGARADEKRIAEGAAKKGSN